MRWSSLCHLVRERAQSGADRSLLRFEGVSLTAAGLDQGSDRAADVLAARGVARGDRVALMLPNGLDFPVAWLAVAKLGAVVVPVNAKAQEADLSHLLNDSRSRFAVTDPEHMRLLHQVSSRCAALEGVVPVADLRGPGATPVVERAIDHLSASDPVTVQYTSGTTGFPKGCLLTHEYWLTVAETTYDLSAFRAGDVTITAAPLSYMDPTWILALCLMTGMELVILPRFSATTFWQSVRETGVTWFYCLGTMPLLLRKQPPDPVLDRAHRVRFVLCSGIPVALHHELEARWGCPWREIYGMTEIGSGLMVPLEDTASVGSGSVGKPTRGREARIVGADERSVPDGAVGELVLRGSGMMLGYFDNAEATAQWRRDGWAHTGDLAYRDERGNIHLAGRLKDMIRRGGENVSAVEVECVLTEHPAVRAAACVPVPDDLRGEEIKAFVQLQPGESPSSATPEALLAFARGRLAPFKVPRYVEYVDRFPLTASERIEKSRLLALKPDHRVGAYDALTQSWS
jgi:crotonobetaine/carnitine-CoA ligase